MTRGAFIGKASALGEPSTEEGRGWPIGSIPYVGCWLGGWCMQDREGGKLLGLCMVAVGSHTSDVG